MLRLRVGNLVLVMIEDYMLNGKWAKFKNQLPTCSGAKWRDMSARCSTHNRNLSYATYELCTVSDTFKDFQIFANWHRKQVGYATNYHLDKDLLCINNTVYHEDHCVLIPPELNYFIRGSVARRGGTPQGVSFDTERQKYLSSISICNKAKNLGRFNTPEEARKAYYSAKNAIAANWHKRLTSGEFIVDCRIVEAMRTWDTEERYYEAR